MRKRTREKVSELRQRPEHERYRAAVTYTIVAAVIIAAVWLLILLPAQIYLSRVRSPAGTATTGQAVQQTAQQARDLIERAAEQGESVNQAPPPAAVPGG